MIWKGVHVIGLRSNKINFSTVSKSFVYKVYPKVSLSLVLNYSTCRSVYRLVSLSISQPTRRFQATLPHLNWGLTRLGWWLGSSVRIRVSSDANIQYWFVISSIEQIQTLINYNFKSWLISILILYHQLILKLNLIKKGSFVQNIVGISIIKINNLNIIGQITKTFWSVFQNQFWIYWYMQLYQ